MIQVCILGAGLPGLIVAEALASSNVKVTVVGKPNQARSTHQIGPMYLWSTSYVRDWLKIRGGYDILDIEERSVIWYGHKDIEGYKEKTGTSSNKVCKGKNHFKVHPCGLKGVWDVLLPRIQENPNIILCEALATYIRSTIHRWHISYSVGGVIRSDFIVNTTPRNVWRRLLSKKRQTKPEDFFQRVYYHCKDWGPFEDHADSGSNTIPRTSRIIYCGDPKIPWFRCSYSPEYRWVYESTEPIEGTWSRVLQFPAKIINAEQEDSRMPHMLHVGRWATLDPEEMISDIIMNRNSIGATIFEDCYDRLPSDV